MNHLCHIFLSQGDPELLIGNFIGDMVLPGERRLLGPGIQKGIDLHYFIDKTVDQHPVYKSGIEILRSVSYTHLDVYKRQQESVQFFFSFT